MQGQRTFTLMALLLSALQGSRAECNATTFFDRVRPNLENCVTTYAGACPGTFACSTNGDDLIDDTTFFPEFALQIFYTGQTQGNIDAMVGVACDLLVCNDNEIEAVKVSCNQSDSPTQGLLGLASTGDVEEVFDTVAPTASCSFSFPPPTSQPTFQPTRDPTNRPGMVTPSPPSGVDDAAIIGGAVGAAAVLGLSAFFLLRQRASVGGASAGDAKAQL